MRCQHITQQLVQECGLSFTLMLSPTERLFKRYTFLYISIIFMKPFCRTGLHKFLFLFMTACVCVLVTLCLLMCQICLFLCCPLFVGIQSVLYVSLLLSVCCIFNACMAVIVWLSFTERLCVSYSGYSVQFQIKTILASC